MKRVYFYGGTEENNYKVSLLDTEENREIAKRDAWDGNIYFEDDGLEETYVPTDSERIAELEEALAMLLSGVVE